VQQRTHDVATSAEQLEALPEPILVSRIAHLVREGGGVHDLDRWLTALSNKDLDRVGRIADATGADRIAVVDFKGRKQPPAIGGLRRQNPTQTVQFVRDVPLQVWEYTRIP
jgi:hypothetical protein